MQLVSDFVSKKPEAKKDEEQRPLEERVAEWLKTQGYPLEFETREVFERHGFETIQGRRVPQQDGDPLEVDVTASMMRAAIDTRLEVRFVVECKYAPEPWVLFVKDELSTSPQCLGNELAETLMTIRRARDEVAVLASFKTDGCAFNVATLKGKDQAFDTVKSVVCRVEGSIDNIDQHFTKSRPPFAVFEKPLVVIRGELCAVRWNSETKQLVPQRVRSASVEYRSATGRRFFVDVVTEGLLDEYLTVSHKHTAAFLEAMHSTADEFDAAWKQGRLSPLRLPRADADRLPRLLALLADSEATTLMLQQQVKNHKETAGRSVRDERL